MPRPIPVAEILEVRPGPELARADRQRRSAPTFADDLRPALPEGRRGGRGASPTSSDWPPPTPSRPSDLAEEFLRVWTRNHDPNAARNYTNPYIYMYGFERTGREHPADPLEAGAEPDGTGRVGPSARGAADRRVDEALLTRAFTASHSSAEVYRLEAIEEVFGSIDALRARRRSPCSDPADAREPGRASGDQPAVQEQAKTNRKEKDIQAEVLRGYEVARSVIDQGPGTPPRPLGAGPGRRGHRA